MVHNERLLDRVMQCSVGNEFTHGAAIDPVPERLQRVWKIKNGERKRGVGLYAEPTCVRRSTG